MDLKVVFSSKDKEKEAIISIESSATVLELKSRIKNEFDLKVPTTNLGLWVYESDSNTSKENDIKVLLSDNNRQLKNYGIHKKMTVIAKNIGSQISWRLVYLVEYLGPIVIFILFYTFLKKPNTTQSVAFLMSTVHYVKRLLESIYVHDFSNSTMPFSNLFKNCGYYWGLYGFLCGYSLLNNGFKESNVFGPLKYVFALLFFFFEYKNYKAHMVLKNLKDNNNGQKAIPYGEGFDLVSCANYFWEFLAWTSFSLYVNHPSFYLFTLCGLFQMRAWALKKHSNYLKTFQNYPKERKAMIPYLT